MGLLTFSGGIHPYDGKDLSKDKVITDYLPKGDAVYPLSQHIGAPAKPCVKAGDMVSWGDVVGTAADGLSVDIHASVAGTVREVTEQYAVIEG